jgi:chromosome segregation ATPase
MSFPSSNGVYPADQELVIYALRSDLHRAIDIADRLRAEAIELRREGIGRAREPVDASLIVEDAKLLYDALRVARHEIKAIRNEANNYRRKVTECKVECERFRSAHENLVAELKRATESLMETRKIADDLREERNALLERLKVQE